jgi:hypothetical protein
MDPASNRRDASAIHEAGHCLELWRSGYAVDRVCGKMQATTHPREDTIDAEARLRVAYAGEEAELLAGVVDPTGCGMDKGCAEDALAELGLRHAEQEARAATRLLLQRQNGALRAVAGRIRRISGRPGDKCVEGDELERIARSEWVGRFPQAKRNDEHAPDVKAYRVPKPLRRLISAARRATARGRSS